MNSLLKWYSIVTHNSTTGNVGDYCKTLGSQSFVSVFEKNILLRNEKKGSILWWLFNISIQTKQLIENRYDCLLQTEIGYYIE